MTIYATTPTGEVVTYHTANYLVHAGAAGDAYHMVYEKKDGAFVADIPTTWAVSFKAPYTTPDSSALAAIKKALRTFDSRTGSFKS
jgi:hypothetical protein